MIFFFLYLLLTLSCPSFCCSFFQRMVLHSRRMCWTSWHLPWIFSLLAPDRDLPRCHVWWSIRQSPILQLEQGLLQVLWRSFLLWQFQGSRLQHYPVLPRSRRPQGSYECSFWSRSQQCHQCLGFWVVCFNLLFRCFSLSETSVVFDFSPFSHFFLSLSPSLLLLLLLLLLLISSAGGLSTYLHIDEIRSMLPKSTVVKAFPGSGYFMDIPNLDDVPVFPMQMENVFYFQDCQKGVNQDCVRANPQAPHVCFFAPHTYPYIQTPLFIVNSFVDSWQMGNVYGVDVPSFANCQYAGPNNCTQDQIDEVHRFSREMVISITASPTFSKAGNGVFLTSCWGHWYVFKSSICSLLHMLTGFFLVLSFLVLSFLFFFFFFVCLLA